VLDALSVPETYFWREFDQIRAIVCRSCRSSPARARPDSIRSAPCATGEEPLTIAMALEEAGWFERASFEIHGSDGSPAAIARAQAGRYRQRDAGAARRAPENISSPPATPSSRGPSWRGGFRHGAS
jgi:chemotaxis protein methyltransferase CheR